MLTLASAKKIKKCGERERPAAIKERLGSFPDARLIPAHFSERAVGFGECGSGAASPRTAIVLASLSVPCSFLGEPNEGTPVLLRCPPPSQLSFHWLHMKNNETSSETRLQKKKKGGVGVVLKEGEIVE